MALTNRNLLSVGFAGVLLSMTSPAIAQNCRPLGVVGGIGTSVTKTVSPPATLWTRNNWNTDFEVPGGARFNRYVVRMTAQTGAAFPTKIFLKYSNNTADNFLNKTVPLNPGQSIAFPATPRPANDPFQVNVFVGGIEVTGQVYMLSVEGCY